MKTIMLAFTFLNLVLTCFAQEQQVLNKYLKDSLTVITQRVEKKVIKARYMEQHLIRTTDTLKGWEGVKVSLYKYAVKDKVKGTLEAEVYMLNPDAKQLAAWVISTCVITTGKLDKINTDTIIQSVRGASGGQFPVLGIVYENMDGKGFKPYFFKDGVTVLLKKNDVIDISQIFDDNIRGTGKYARIISTTREEYHKKYGAANLEGTQWLDVVRQAYKAAMNSNTNTLFIAWANGKLH